MHSSQFIQIRQEHSDVVLNTAHIISIKRHQHSVTAENRSWYPLIPLDSDVAYTVHINTTATEMQGGETIFYCVTKEERDVIYRTIVSALNAVVIPAS